MSIRIIAAIVATTFLVTPVFAQTTAKPAATTAKPAAAPAATAPAAAEEEGTGADIKVCNAKWAEEKKKAGAKTGAKAWHEFMAKCL